MRLRNVLITAGALIGVLAVAGAVGIWLVLGWIEEDPFTPLYVENCAACHGEQFQGGALGPALVAAELRQGDSVEALVRSIGGGFPERGMPGWDGILDDGQIRSLAILIAERRVDRRFTDFKTDKALMLPVGVIDTDHVSFRVEPVAAGIDPKPFSIAPLPDGRILLTEKIQGLTLVGADGSRSAPLAGTPATYSRGVEVLGLDYGLGWLLDVKPHPHYETNGWIYLLHTDLCAECGDGGDALVPATMTRLVRGHIEDGAWRDEQVVWSVDQTFYTAVPDLGAGGRISFDPAGYVFLTVGIKGLGNYVGIQDLGTPYGKVHRVHDDGRIPTDNPFVDHPGALPSVWSYGHRSPQGLEFDPSTGVLWGTEMGPRGGDEVNRLLPGRNYGWPLYSTGVDYDGTPVEYWKELGIEFDLEDIEQPVVDLTPSPAVSSFVVYDGAAFADWQGDLIVGSLKATELYRFRIGPGGEMLEREVLLRDLARIRDIEVAHDGTLLLLLEHAAGSRIVRLAPAR